MSHLTDRTLESLIAGSASAIEVQRIRRHAEQCRACARRLEEWRDNFAEVQEHFPELSIESDAGSMVTPGGLVLLPSTAPRRRFAIDLTRALWIGAMFMAVLVLYGAMRLRQPSGRAVADYNLPQPVDPDSETRQGAMPTPTPDRSDPPVKPATPATRPDTKAPATPPAQRPTESGAAARPTTIPVSPRFKSATLAEAENRLGGPVRLLQGMEVDHVEIGPASAVPGAQSGLSVIRVVYRAADGGRILLDQQLIPEDSTGFRPIEDPTLESGATAFGTSKTGVSVATWLEDGYRISLATRTSMDSLKQLIPLVQ